MSATLQDLLQQREALDKAIAQARQNEISAAVSQVRELIAQYQLTVQDVFPGRAGRAGATKSTRKPVPAKYRDHASGQTWTGQGKAPKWIEGKDRAQFSIAMAQNA
ncbi:H-NS histone family protein [Limnohabitans sp. JUR4]|uniref:H-NS histone family protein n=2 Tax=Limnohabitans radicicola TaxID=2771427 RepID=A0A927FIE9_9BURK|nr:H-NS histone family protein [Limnohabitans radicicola]MBD8051092.1 H-NS histone family protein [Limnohabitans radicicola]